ncbi:MAG: hypothetical protein AAF740_04690 [Bacteroidota bacterium]
MSAQLPHLVWLGKEKYELSGSSDVLPFDPKEYNLKPAAPHPKCWRGYVCQFRVEEETLFLDRLEVNDASKSIKRREQLVNEKKPSKNSKRVFRFMSKWGAVYFNKTYRKVKLPLSFSGQWLLTRGGVWDQHAHYAMHPAWRYKEIHLLKFEAGRLVFHQDLGDLMARIRNEVERLEHQGKDFSEIHKWVREQFDDEKFEQLML